MKPIVLVAMPAVMKLLSVAPWWVAAAFCGGLLVLLLIDRWQSAVATRRYRAENAARVAVEDSYADCGEQRELGNGGFMLCDLSKVHRGPHCNGFGVYWPRS